ncbi:MAG TPA: hypothetical protein VNC22_08165, partial [Sporichthya sp.]|nr:hypothetical protein [Sporichthya sp.]
FQLVTNTFTDPCSNKETTPAVGPTVDDLATALVADPALRVTAPKAVQLAGYPGVSLTYDPAEGVSCVGEDSRTWALPADRILPVGPLGPPTWPLRAGTHRVWILDINGTRLVIDASAGPTPAAPLSAEVQAVVDSVQFGPLTHPITIGACTLNIDHQSSPPGQPLEVTLGPSLPGGLNGPAPNPFPSLGPVAWLNFRGEGWQEGRGSPGGPRMIPPPGATTTGFQTTTTVNGYAGSWVFDAPGTWWVKFTGDLSGCVRQFPVIVHPAP